MTEITDRIYRSIDSMVLDVGRELQLAFEEHPKLYEAWVTECLPFGLDKARRLRSIWKASLMLPPEILEQLPRPWQGMYAVTRMPPAELEAAVRSGDIHPAMSARDAISYARGPESVGRFSAADVVAGKLMGHPPHSLAAVVRDQLRVWIDGADNTEGRVPD